MNMAENNYIDSSKITMYPSAYRGQNGEGKVYNPTSYLNTEDNITSLIRSVASKDCFIIDSNEGAGHRVRLCMRGYVFDFELDGLPAEIKNSPKIYASVRLDKIAVDESASEQAYELHELYPYETGLAPKRSLDYKIGSSAQSNDKFLGLFFTAEEPAKEANVYSLLIWENGKFPEKSKLRIDSSAIADSAGGPISSEFTTDALKLNIGNDKDHALYIGPDHKIQSYDATVYDGAFTLDSGAIVYVSSVTSDAKGKITVERKQTMIMSSPYNTQAEFIVNEKTIPITGLGKTDSPMFRTIKVTDGSIKSSIATVALPAKDGQLATVDYNSAEKTLTIDW